jgi:hypothetical protein
VVQASLYPVDQWSAERGTEGDELVDGVGNPVGRDRIVLAEVQIPALNLVM